MTREIIKTVTFPFAVIVAAGAIVISANSCNSQQAKTAEDILFHVDDSICHEAGDAGPDASVEPGYVKLACTAETVENLVVYVVIPIIEWMTKAQSVHLEDAGAIFVDAGCDAGMCPIDLEAGLVSE